MIILNTTSDAVEAVLTSAAAVNQLQCASSYRDITTTTFIPSRNMILTSDTTAVSIVPAPDTDNQRVVDFISVFNSDTANATVTIQFNDGSGTFTLWKGVLLPNEKVEYAEGSGFRLISNGGVEKTAVMNATSPASSVLNIVTLAADVVNNNATLNTIADVDGLAVPITAGNRYWFRFHITYTAQATTTGSRWSVFVPANNYFAMTSNYTLTATSNTPNNIIANDIPAASNATSLGNGSTTGNMCVMEGFITPTEDGYVQARFASEAANSAITAKQGSFVEWLQVI